MNLIEAFRQERQARIDSNAGNASLQQSTVAFLNETIRAGYSYNFEWLSRPIIQYPQDMVAMQELIWRVRPDLIVETGIAHGGSLILSASMLAMLDYCDAVEAGSILDPRNPRRRVLGLDIDIRAHNRAAIEAHPMAHRIDMIQGSSVAPEVIGKVREIARGYQRIMVCLDSNHTHEHVLAELEAYAPLVSKGSYCCVFDTVIEDLPEDSYPDRPWGVGDNPKTAVREYLRRLTEEGRVAADGASLDLEIDKTIENKLLLTVAPDGYLRRL
ncbi:cephalosporin hydroxylase family protein [Noviherbaspirillum denitrificans]|uniref:Cephalosporin hydroxylase n=1 Tax=Noviherbaspirillum denitrificans TaxID=1968433 RepID=A0A254TF88_9BURK|nr:cephalosporin hydroxylase family protein [Noviherbaspirillum denitrificans]OWW21301.1 cephalosporin hydroxylase [Noviherbaspirillum denitrificans]